MFDRLTTFCEKHARGILVLAALWLLVAIGLLLHGSRLATGAIHGLESERADRVVEQVTGRASDTTFLVLFESPRGLDPSSDAFVQDIDRALAPLRSDPRVSSVTAPSDAGPVLANEMINSPAHAAFAYVSMAGDFGEAARNFAGVRSELQSDDLAITCTGRVATMRDLDRLLHHDLVRAEAVSLPVCVLLLGAVFGTAVAALLPVCIGVLAVVSGLAAVVLLSHWTEVASYTLNVCSLLGLGLAIDYSLFVVDRYREELDAGCSYSLALRRAMSTAGRVVLFSGVAVTSGLGGLFFFPRSYLMSIGLGGAVVVAFSVGFAFTVLPALLSVLGPRIHALRFPFAFSKRNSATWHHLAQWVMRRPLTVLVPSLTLLLAMGSPFFRLQNASPDVRILPTSTEARAGYELLRKDFPDLGATHVVTVVAFPTSPALNADRIGALYDFIKRVASLPSVQSIGAIVDPSKPLTKAQWSEMLLSPPAPAAARIEELKKASVGPNAVIVDVSTPGAPESPEARAIVRSIRSDRRVADGTVLVGGQAATDIDTTNYILERMPRAALFVVAITCIVLFLLLGSVLLPIKAVLMNVLSIAGSFGALVWVFQEGHLFIREPRPVDPTLPVILFCMLFGLSMDYEVLMLTRMKEAFDRTGDDRAAVAEGLEKCAGLITSAAAIMVAVFGAFTLARIVLIQAVGFGMALAVALDATVVRVLVVPSTMRLLGQLNWWAPRPLAALHRALRLESGPHGG